MTATRTRNSAAIIIGNGLSIAMNDALRLDHLTRDFLDSHAAEREDLDRLVAGIHLGSVDPAHDFEGLVAGLESAEEVISAFMGLARGATHPQLREAAELLERNGVPALARRLYYAYCAEVLDAIGEAARGSLPGGVVGFADWLKATYEAHDGMGLFTLNYDVLLERMLVDENVLGLKHALTDFFSGLEDRQQLFELVPGREQVLGRLFYPEDPVVRPIELHHLHGCLTHFRMLEDGTVWKFDASGVRGIGVYDHLMDAEEAAFAPSVILGSRKVEKAREWPFSYAFLSLEQEARAARTVVVAGYSFRDEAVNARLSAAASSAERRWIVINRKKDPAEAEEFKKRVSELLGVRTIEFALDGFEGGLPEIG
jgi:hypothetical protein